MTSIREHIALGPHQRLTKRNEGGEKGCPLFGERCERENYFSHWVIFPLNFEMCIKSSQSINELKVVCFLCNGEGRSGTKEP